MSWPRAGNEPTGHAERMFSDFGRDRLSVPLNALRWLFIGAPLVALLPELTAWTALPAAVVLLASVPLLWLPPQPAWLLPACLIVLAAASATLWVARPASAASVLVFATIFHAARLLSPRTAAVAGAILAAGVVTMVVRYEITLRGALLNLALVGVVVLLGLNRRGRAARLEQTELALARARTAAEEHALAAALAERARIARELHDVLAHSLSGLALNLQGARLMLLRDGASADALAQVERAQRLASDGIAEARRAVAALRDDPVPLERAIADLVTGYRLEGGARSEVLVEGEPRPVDAVTGNTVVRAAQEALANTRKHAPGSAVDVVLTFAADEVRLTVTDHQGSPPAAPVAQGYGLRGMRERVQLIGGRVSAGPAEDGWRVHLAVPA